MSQRNGFKIYLVLYSRVIPPLKKLHVLEKYSFDIAILGEAITKENRIEEKEFIELTELKVSNLDEVITALEKLSLSYPKFIIPTVVIDLGTKVKIKNQELIYSESAQLYLGTNDFAIVGEKDKIHISYSTYIDVWLKEIFDNWVLKDNTEYAKLNHPRLEEFLLAVEKNLGVGFEKG